MLTCLGVRLGHRTSLRKQTQAISSATIGVANRNAKQPSFRVAKPDRRYLHALLTKSEIELKPSQCKIQ